MPILNDRTCKSDWTFAPSKGNRVKYRSWTVFLRAAVPKRDFLVFSGAPERAAFGERHIAIPAVAVGRGYGALCRLKRSRKERERYSN